MTGRLIWDEGTRERVVRSAQLNERMPSVESSFSNVVFWERTEFSLIMMSNLPFPPYVLTLCVQTVPTPSPY